MSNSSLQERISTRQATVGILGLGYVGLPLALVFGEGGFKVLGFDVDASKVDALTRGECYIRHLDAARLAALGAAGRFSATTDFSRLTEADALLICVPTPLSLQREPDLSYVVKTAEQIAATLRPGQLVVLESTTYPGTTDQVVRGILDRTGLSLGSDYFLAFSPEREDPGNPNYGTANIPKVVGGVDAISGDLAEALYGAVLPRIVRVSHSRAAEATKLVENIFRAVNIALVNELKVVYDRMGIDVWEVLDAAATKPFGFMRFTPGPGLGGHCIPLDPFYLSWKAREFGIVPKFIELAGEINTHMPDYVVDKLAGGLNRQGKPVKGSRVLVLGLAYKKDIDDPRESPAFEVIEKLLHLEAIVSYHDPFIPLAPKMRSWPDLPELRSIPLDAATLAAQDAVMIVTDHTAVDYDLVVTHSSLVIDTRGVYRTPRPNVIKA